MEDSNLNTSADTKMRNNAAMVGAVIGQTILRRYKIRRLLGVGAMGHVIEVRDIQSNEEAAVKCVPPQLAGNDQHMVAIKANYDLVKGLIHPNIGALGGLERDPDNGQYYLLMELIRGVDLAQWIIEQRVKDPKIPVDIVLGIAEQIAAALDYAHSCPVNDPSGNSTKRFGILHRDLKPANVMVERDREYRPGVPFVKLVDFGLAAQIQASLHAISLTSLNKLAGTPVYMAPEQWEGRTLTRGVDQWALAVMMYEMIAGYRPFDGPTETVVMANVKHANPVKPAALTDRQWAALKIAFSADRRKRYRSCMALVKAFAAADSQTCESIAASEVSMPDEFAEPIPSSPIAAASSGDISLIKWVALSAVVALICGGGVLALLLHLDKGATLATPVKPTTPVTAPQTSAVANVTKPTITQNTPDKAVKKEESASARRNRVKDANSELTNALEEIINPKYRRSWRRIVDLLEAPVAMPANSNHPSFAAAKALLDDAHEQLKNSPGFTAKLQEAKDHLTNQRYELALKAFEEAREIWPQPEPKDLDENLQGIQKSRDAIAVEKGRQAFAKALNDAKNAKSPSEIVQLLTPVWELDDNKIDPNYGVASDLLRNAKARLANEKKVKIAQDRLRSKRYDDALELFKLIRAEVGNDEILLAQIDEGIAAAQKEKSGK